MNKPFRNNNAKRARFRGSSRFQLNARGRGRGRSNQQNSRFQRKSYKSEFVEEFSNEWPEDKNVSFLDEDTRNYFNRVLESLQTGFENKAEEEVFVTNVLTQTEEKELLLSCNKLGSKCLQQLLPLAELFPDDIMRFSQQFSNDLLFVCTHHFASHIVESLLNVSAKIVLQISKENNCTEFEKSSRSELFSWILSVANFFTENIDNLLYNLYASHVFSSLLQILSGQNVNENVIRSKRSMEYKKGFFANEDHAGDEQKHTKYTSHSSQDLESNCESNVPEEFSQMFRKFALLFRQKNLPELCSDRNASPVLQVVLLASAKTEPKLCQKILKCIIKGAISNTENGKVSSFITNQVCSHVMERVISLADEKRKRYLWKHLLNNNLKAIALHPVGNFVLQIYQAAIEDSSQVEKILNEIGPCFEEIFSARHFGIIVSLSEVCKRLKTGQAFFTKSLFSAFHCWEPEDRQKEIVPLLLNMVQHEEYNTHREDFKLDKDGKGVNLHGSLILQNMFCFNKPNKLTNSLLSLTSEELRNVVCDPKGSHVVDSFVRSTYVGENFRDKLIQLLRPEFVLIVCNKHGSRSLDTIWEVSSLKQKRIIAEELSKKEKVVSGDMYGRFFAKRIGLSYFKHRLRDWEQAQTVNNKKRKLFQDIIGY